MKRFFKFIFTISALAAGLAFFSCSADDMSESESKTTIYLSSASITAGFDSSVTIYAFATTSDSTINISTLSFESSNPSVIALKNSSCTNGDKIEAVTGSSAGSAKITVKCGDTSKTISVTVKETESAVSSETWNASDYSTPSEGESLGIMTAILGSKSITRESSGLKFSGGGSMTECALKFTMSRSAKITINRDTVNERTLALYNGTQKSECTSSTASSFSYNYTNSGSSEDFYIYSKGSGITIFSVTIEYTDTASDSEIVYPTALSFDSKSISLDDDNISATLTATIENASSVTSGYDTISYFTFPSSAISVSTSGTVYAKTNGTATIYATTINGLVDTCSVTAAGITEKIRATDIPTGYAGVGFTSFYDSNKVVTVSTKSDLVSYAKKGGYTIYVDGMIDMSEGMLPSGKSGNSTTALDAFVASNSAYSTYSEYNSAKLSSVSESADWTNPLNNTYRNTVRFSVASNTAIIGLKENCGIKGGGISISSSNVIIRNLLIQDGYDPFPNHEANDGWNAQVDAIAVTGKNVWVDHCTLEDTIELGTAPNASNESYSNHKRFQTYDGICDITNGATYVTVSNCIIRNHDKTMLIGSSSSDTSGGYITLANNRIYGCGQRLPLTCYKNMHIYNNYYGDQSGFYSNSYAIGARYAVYTIIAEGNYFGSGISDAFKASTSPSGTCYAKGNSTNSGSLTTTSSKPFTVPYDYDYLSYSEAKSFVSSNAGAGVITVKQ